MSDFIIFGVHGSPYVRSVCLALEEKGQSYRLEPMGAGLQPGEAPRHPFGRLPAFGHGDFRLYETQAILRYIDALLPDPPLQPIDPKAIARMSQIIGINDCYLFPQVCRVIVFQRIVGPVLFGHTPDEALITAAVPDTQRCIAELDRLLGAAPFLAGDRLTLADLMIAPQLEYLAATPEGRAPLEGTRLKAWLQRMQARPSMQATLPPPPLRIAA